MDRFKWIATGGFVFTMIFPGINLLFTISVFSLHNTPCYLNDEILLAALNTIDNPMNTKAPNMRNSGLQNLFSRLGVLRKYTLRYAMVGVVAGTLMAIAGFTDPAEPERLPIFDTHVHYSQNSWNQYSSEQIIEKMKAAGVH